MKATGSDFLSLCREKRRTDTSRKYQSVFPMFDASLPKLPSSWVWASVSELCERVSVGHVGPTSEFFSTKEEGVPFVRSQDVRPGRLMVETVAHVTRDFHNKLKKSQLKTGDVLVVRVGANRGDCCVVPDAVGELNCANIVFARPIFPNGFIGFFLRSELGQSLLASLTTGSAQGVLNTQSIAAIPIPIPPLPTQRKIAGVLSAYDDLIENNTRRIAILEEMAQAIYREWFVNFRFPGHEKVKLINSPLGKIPEGWKVEKVKSIVKRLTTNGHYTQNDVVAVGTVPVIDQSTAELLGYHDNAPDLDASPDSPVIIFGDHTCKMELVVTPFSIGPNVVPFQSATTHSVHYLYWLVNSLVETKEYKRHWSELTTKEVLVCSGDLSDRFTQATIPLVEAMNLYRKRNRCLRKTLDLLLPKLISGQLDVEEVDIDAEVPLVEAEA